jgi:eukaryotic-like serine/threonine-protein kinase
MTQGAGLSPQSLWAKIRMQKFPSDGRFACFGPFEADLEERKLQKMGNRIRLQEQPFRILALLLEHPGQLVSREEIRRTLWPGDVFVDFDAALNTAVRKLREALNDSADNPRFLETVPREGYRFIAPITWQPDLQLNPRTVRRQSYLWLAAAVILAGAAVGGFWLLRRPGYKISPKGTIVVADFANSTGDPVFDDTLKTALTIALRQSPFLSVVSDNKVASTLKLMTRSADTRLTPDLAREVCQRLGSQAYIAGSIAGLGNQYVVGLKAIACQTGDTLVQEQATTSGKEKVLDALGKAEAKLRGELGESLASVERFDVPLYQATTSSLEALKAYSLAAKAAQQANYGAALSYGRRAIELDPNFAAAYAEVGDYYLFMTEVSRANECFTKAFQLREHASEREKLWITEQFYENVTGELKQAGQIAEQRTAEYPRDFSGYIDLGNVYAKQGYPEKAAEQYRNSIRVAPDIGAAYEILANALLASQRFDEARQIVEQPQARKRDDVVLHNALYALAFLSADSPAEMKQQQWFASMPDFENFGLSLASDTAAYAGHLGKARELTKRSSDSAVRANIKEIAAIWLENAALREAAFGNLRQAKQAAAEGLKLAPSSQGVEDEAALAYAMAGDTTRSESVAQYLNERYPLDTQVQSMWLPAIRAQVALRQKRTAAALRSLQVASGPIEFGQIVFVNNYSCLYPTYARGEGYLAAGQGAQAAAEFQKILNHNGIVWNCWTGALAHLGVARANALQVTTSQGANAAARMRALVAYKDFLELWKDADPDIPILKEATAEYTKLQHEAVVAENGKH